MMKIHQMMGLALCGGLMAGTALGATDEITITGSTAFRNEIYLAVQALYNSAGSTLQSQNPAGDASKATQVTWQGTLSAFGSDTVVIRTSWSGSATGIGSLANNSSVTVLATATPGDTNTLTKLPDLAMSDVFQASTIYSGGTFPSLIDNQVGVIPFVFVRGPNTPATVNNITHKLLNTILASGFLPVFQFTGNPADTANIGLIGRDSGSGTRATIHADSGYGVFTTATLGQTNIANGTLYYSTLNGYSSGGTVKNALNAATVPALGYLGLADAANVTGSPNNQLTYNGVTCTFDNVRNGVYSLWAYEHLYNRPDVSANASKFRDLLISQLAVVLSTSTTAIVPSTMKVSRNTDGAPITP